MQVLHAFWLPEPNDGFRRPGAVRLWAETSTASSQRAKRGPRRHPFSVTAQDWPSLLETIGVKATDAELAPHPHSIWLPSTDNGPLPSPELARRQANPPETSSATLKPWQVDCPELSRPIRQLRELSFLAVHRGEDVQLGNDFLFWSWFTQSLKRLLVRDLYVPGLAYGRAGKPRSSASSGGVELHGTWRWVSAQYEALIADAAERMPAVCAAGLDGLAEPQTLLRHCAEVLLDLTVRRTPLPRSFDRKRNFSLLDACLDQAGKPWRAPGPSDQAEQDIFRHWRQWHARITSTERDAAFTTGFQLVEPPASDGEDWTLRFVAIPAEDPSQRLPLAEYWSAKPSERAALRKALGRDFETQLLLGLGLAARMVPKLWDGLATAEPQSLVLDTDGAYEFLKESAWVLEDAGFKVIVPAWYTPQGRRRAKIRLRSATTRAKSTSGGSTGADSGLNLDNLIQYRYQLAIGDQNVSDSEWQRLVESKTPLVRFRGEWIELDRERMAEMLKLWREQGADTPEISVQELLTRTASDDAFEVDHDDALAGMLGRLQDHRRLEPVTDLPGLNAELRDYQKRGVAWLRFLEDLGLNGCLADDMGLGKTMQVIARLVQEREGRSDLAPTLLIAPTSVIGNWHKEVERFAPGLTTLVHHGPQRIRKVEDFAARAAGVDLLITSYALARLDHKLLAAAPWQRVVLDEAQNIKNPKAAQTKAVLKLDAPHRLALTGTPVENRLSDLWSIFNFTNPGYLDTQARFRKRFELPVQRDNDPVQTETLKRLVAPLILRRVKTDKSIIRDLPDKVEAVQYCNLGKEQAALYESVVRDVERQLEEKDGIERQGLMLSTLMRLKQICNHPAQFLQDGSAFSRERSHKLERLEDMLEEVAAEGDSALIFSQFTEIGSALEQRLRSGLHYNTHYLHGGTTRTRREAMIASFQDPAGEPSVFVLSLKAGGVGITLTRANHVFHFDRWWNPAVEDQASDRAYRIGQEKTVFVHKFVTLGTLEERIHALIEQKKALAGAIIGNDESWLTQLDNERFKALIRLERSEVVD